MLDARKFPLAAEYLARLPKGLDSYPECQARVDSFEYLRATHAELAEQPGLPEPVFHVLSGQHGGAWIPEALGAVIFLLLRDSSFSDDAAFLHWSQESTSYVFRKPWARVLMQVLSPTLVIMGAQKRWREFHRGSSLNTHPAVLEGKRASVHASLSFPPHLFPPLGLRMLERSFAAAIATTRAGNVVSTLTEWSETQATFVVSWDH